MAFNQTQFFENLEKLTTKVIDKNKIEDFIFDFLTLLDVSKSTITSLKKNDGRFNVAANPEAGEVANKHRIYFKPVEESQDLAKALSEVVSSPIINQHKIRMVMVTDFNTVLINDTKYDETLDCDFADLYKNYHFLLPLAGLERAREYSEHPADVQASEKMGRLFDHIRKLNEFNTADDLHALNIFLTRLLFCFYAEDTGIFKADQFYDVIDRTTNIDGSDVDSILYELFEVLDLPESSPERDAKPTHLSAFPYVNGSLFEYQFAIPEFDARTRRILLECARLSWAEINPDIFGSMFQAVIDPEQRGSLGQHYTSVSNIMKVIQPLFLDELRTELDTVIALSHDNRHKNNKAERLDALLTRISQIKVFDPACGSGNFLIIAYKELRKLEINVLKAQRDLIGSKDNLLGLGFDSVVSLDNLYGIEYDDFASQIARLSLWLAEHQMNVLFEQEFGASQPMLPLKDSGHIVYGNSLRLDWNEVCPNNGSDEIYIIGNPPFGGRNNHSDSQNNDMEKVFEEFSNYKTLDYVSSWLWKGSKYISNTNAELALVATNSIAQGAQVAMLFPYIFEIGISIRFAYQTFPWKNNAKHNAAVHVVIIGLSSKSNINKTIYKLIDMSWHTEIVKTISPYLIKGDQTVVGGRSETLNTSKKMVFGSMPRDGGFLFLDQSEKEKFELEEPQSIHFIKKVLGSREFLNSQERWCLWLEDFHISNLDNYPLIKEKVTNVEIFRLDSKAKSTRNFAKTPHLFAQRAQPKSGNYILVPGVTSERRQYVPIGFYSHEVIATNLVNIIPNGTIYDFAILTSLIHNDWMRLVAGRLESRYRYSGTIVYNTFPFPDATDEQKQNIENLAEEILLARASNAGLTLAELYDPDKMPKDLKQAHSNLDNAVDKLYRPQGFANTEERLAHLLARYEQLIEAEKQSKAKKKAQKKSK
ncbi:class I SAM-dependent DNA methyltransferase [Psychrobacter sp. 230]|uniref:class I SAM-dependent DNA methyltransferase n=1 Tax=Psychrobacter sp. 230 TaxID=2555884 RepID=UPI0010683120|nr:DNA methyltransferase [Psychrobacter sp. 230]TEW83159.1 class I SAM-dependent DNA methyltransferase [Psychrobacter sp. 230]|tara:strand:+ start:1187 stop:3979 length:2793 start_codon:yes stop_codon:yes gene_type:complete